MDVICGYTESPTTSTTHKPFLPPRITPPVPTRSNHHLKQQQQQQQQLLETESITPLDSKDTFRPSLLLCHNHQPEKLVKKPRNANEYLADKENIIVHKSSKQRDLGSLLLSTKVPPIPPRVPLTRSISLTYRPPPPPISDAVSATESLSTNCRRKDGTGANNCRLTDNPFNGLDNIPTIVDPLKPRRRGGVPQVRSAPTLNNVHNVSNVNNAHVKHLVALSPGNHLTIRQHHDKGVADNQTIIPLARWPLTETQPRTNHPFLDSLASRLHGSTNEYVDSPRTISRTKSLISTLNLTNNGNNFTTSSRALNELSWGSHGTSLNRACNASIVVSTTNFKEKKQRNMLKKLKLFVNNNRTKRGSVDADIERPSLNSHLTYQSTVTNTTALVDSTTTPTTGECTNSIICRQCGRCRCKDHMNSSRRTGRIASSIQDESLLDCLSCMCAIKPIFYHCLKDSNGEDDCSEEPCACCSQPNCFPRWAILGMFLPCLPCLCFYLPLRCLLNVCLGCFSNNIGCQCEHKSLKSSGFKTLLESENSSA